MNSIPGTDPKIDEIYFDYLNRAKEITTGMRRFLLRSPYFLISVVLLLFNFWGLCYGLIGTSAYENRNFAAFAAWFWVLAIPLTLIGSAKAQNWVKDEVFKVSESKKGFSKFFDLHYRKRWWPGKMVTGNKYEQFLSIIGRQQ